MVSFTITTESLGRAAVVSPRRWTISPRAILFAVVFALVGFFVLYPLGFLVSASLQVGAYGQPTTFGFGNWTASLSDPNLRSAIVNTLTLTATRQAIAFVAAIVLAWLFARTNLPARQWLEFGFPLITSHTDDFTKTDAQTIEFNVSVKPDEEKTLDYSVHYSW